MKKKSIDTTDENWSRKLNLSLFKTPCERKNYISILALVVITYHHPQSAALKQILEEKQEPF